MAKIQDRELVHEDIHSPVTYIPRHADGDAGHPDAEPGVIIRWDNDSVFVLYSKSRTIQRTSAEDLVWG